MYMYRAYISVTDTIVKKIARISENSQELYFELPFQIGHFRVPKTTTFKMRPTAQPFL